MARPRSSGLTPAHLRVLGAISRALAGGFPPSVADLADSLNLAGVTSVVPTLRIMERNGFVTISGGGERGKRRSVNLTARGKGGAIARRAAGARHGTRRSFNRDA